jgi:hypothetical protein
MTTLHVHHGDQEWTLSEHALQHSTVLKKNQNGGVATFTEGTPEAWHAVMDYLERHAGFSTDLDQEARLWVKQQQPGTMRTMMGIYVVAHVLECTPLAHACRDFLAAEWNACATAQDMRSKFGLPDDLAPQEKQRIAAENACDALVLSKGDW